MYGMIHRAIHDFMSEQLTQSELNSVRDRFHISPEDMVSSVVYSDAMTDALIQSAADAMGIGKAAMLEQLGRFWISFSAKGAYRHILDFTGKDLPSFIQGLDRMHQAVILAMPKADVPSFELIGQCKGELLVNYLSNRQGLEPFVVGLLHGLIARFGHRGTVEHKTSQVASAQFLVIYE